MVTGSSWEPSKARQRTVWTTRCRPPGGFSPAKPVGPVMNRPGFHREATSEEPSGFPGRIMEIEGLLLDGEG